MPQQVSQPLAVADVRLLAWHRSHVLRVDEQERAAVVLQNIEVGSERGAVWVFRTTRFLAPPSEPDVRVGPVSGSPRTSVGYVMTLVTVTHGEAIAAPRKR